MTRDSDYSLDGDYRLIAVRRSRLFRRWFFVLIVVVGLIVAFGWVTRISTRAVAYDAGVPTAWFNLSLQLIQETPGYTPPVASRALGYLGVTLYETVQPGMWEYRSLAGTLNELDTIPQPAFWLRYHWPAAANAALATMTRRLFPTASLENQAQIDALEAEVSNLFQQTVDAQVFADSVVWGRRVADAVYIWSANDGGHAGYARNVQINYVPPTGDYSWVSTPPAYGRALQPSWGENRPFALPNADACPAGSPPAYSEAPDSDFYREALEVYTVDRTRTEEEHAIAVFWSDDAGQTATPPGHWVSILNQVIVAEQATLDVAAEAYARLGIALADSFITCWATKYEYNLLRPITYIQRVIDPAWYPNGVIAGAIVTPPFPEYTSGHSVQSAAAAEVLSALFGDAYAFIDATHVNRGLPPRSFDSFWTAAEEAAASRLYGGIHFRAAILEGVAQGRCVGEQVNAIPLRR